MKPRFKSGQKINYQLKGLDDLVSQIKEQGFKYIITNEIVFVI